MQISDRTKWEVTIAITVFFGIAAIVSGIVIGVSGIKALNGAFRQAESTIESGFSQTASILGSMHEANVETSVIMALGSKGDRPAWGSFLQRATEEAVNARYIRLTETSFVTTPAGEERLSVYIQREIEEVVKENPNSTLEELAAAVIEKLGVRRVSSLAKDQRTSLNEMVAIVAGFAERIRVEE